GYGSFQCVLHACFPSHAMASPLGPKSTYARRFARSSVTCDDVVTESSAMWNSLSKESVFAIRQPGMPPCASIMATTIGGASASPGTAFSPFDECSFFFPQPASTTPSTTIEDAVRRAFRVIQFLASVGHHQLSRRGLSRRREPDEVYPAGQL